MKGQWLSRTLASSLFITGSALAQEPTPTESEIVPLAATQPNERLSVLPDLPTLIRPPDGDSEKTLRTPDSTPARPVDPKKAALYDPRLNYLPETNPGTRQPPCPCLPLGRFWLVPSYFLGVTQNDSIPPLVLGGGNGQPGSPGTILLFGNQRVEHDFRSGFRINTGLWIDRCQNLGLEGDFFFLESSQVGLQAASQGDVALSRPFVTTDGQAFADWIAGPALGPGAIRIDSPLNFLGAEANTRSNLFCEDLYRLDLIVGYRFARLHESLQIHTHQQIAGGLQHDVSDAFRSSNHFHGGQIGIAGEMRWNRWYIDALAKIAFGVNWQEQTIEGASRIQLPGRPTTITPNGLLTAASNRGRTHYHDFAVLPEAKFHVGYQIGDHLRAFAGYTFLYLSRVTRPGEMIDLTIDNNLLARQRPARQEAHTDFWMHGINLGMELRY